ncbi:macro domain-containing protein [Acinetobacter sp. SwsAc6]|uniref:type II toxin-antitoxin system antitoxin DNA ADP-ribosyl glycohydrolase DarG n=1 Tax=Acinetobacter TaxID=469 RepID=UPI000D12E8FE|nr:MULTISPECIES: macro domain-containing protein [Acinetobacter]NWK74609.1 macro domain-containing protein [Acinetobacter sp. SwsAc6]QCO21519.1 Appr-1-p processing protein [Acinetobacter cumulans]RFS27977.1 Appr-1-p processing protein [Acinetobacter sp. SWAC5]RKG47085.1 Appr-1-p processing protein [Acinetobacter cumulans]
MIRFTHGDILKADVEAIVNTVNCVGVMGRGIALQFKKAWPENFKQYALACKHNEVVPGKMFVYETLELTNPRYIVNFPTKRHWKGASRIEDIDSGLNSLALEIKNKKISSIAIPPLGAGLGGLDWHNVKDKIVQHLSDLSDVDILVFEPLSLDTKIEKVINKKVPKMTPGRAILIELMQRYLKGLLDPFVSLLEVQKLLYFMQEVGEPLRLNYTKAHYGPYADNLRHVLNVMEGHYIHGYDDGGDDPSKALSLVPGAIEEAREFLKSYPETLERFEKVTDIVDGFESRYGLELLASVHWVAKYEGSNNREDLVNKIHNWNLNKKNFTPRQIDIAYKNLQNNYVLL